MAVTKLKITLQKQVGPNNCWAAVLSMALEVFGIKKTEAELDQMYNANGRGLNLDEVNERIPDFFPSLTTDYRSEIFTGVSEKLTFQEIQTAINNTRPILIGVNNYQQHKAHALLIYGYDTTNSMVIIADPWTGKEVQVSYQELASWSGNTNQSKPTWTETLILKKK